jgi:hypothetical protein
MQIVIGHCKMTRQKTIDILIYSATGFTIAHGLLSFLMTINRQLYDNISLHYSDSLTWYFIFFFVPLLAGLTFYLWLKNKYISKGLKILFGSLFILQLAFTLTASIMNYKYWGYAFKRPPVFNEILCADKVLTCSRVSNIDSTGIKPLHVVEDTTKSLDDLYGRKDFYYGTSDRIFMVFQDRAHINGHLYDFPKIYNNPELKASKDHLFSIDKQIKESNLVDKGEKNWDTSGQLNGIVTEFVTEDNTKYIFAGLSGGQVSNDHYPKYEFLFAVKNNQYELIKKQRFYTDVAGIEGLEYANIAPFFSLLLTAIGLVVAIIIGTTNKILKRNKQTVTI